MNDYVTSVRVGVFAVALVGAGYAIYTFIVKDAVQGDGYTVQVRMDDASGIAKYSEVKMAGIPVGKIERVYLDDQGKARVVIRMREDVPLYDDASAAKVSSSLLGEYYISVAQGTETHPRLPEGALIPNVVEAATTDEILKDVRLIAKDVKKVTGSLANSIGTQKGEEDIKDTLDNLRQITDQLNQVVRENRESIRNIVRNVETITAEGQPKIDSILSNVDAATNDVRALLAKTEGQEPGEVREIIDKVNRASTSLESALENVDTVTGRIERGEGTIGRLTKDEKLINEVEGVAEGIGEFVGGITRLQTVVALRTDYQFLTSTVKSYVSLRLQPREDKYYLVQIVNDPKGLTTFEQVNVESTNPNDPPQYREVRTVTTNQFRFSLQFAKRFGNFTGRFGIMESTGGIGLDANFLDDRLEIQQDVFGFGEVVLPRWRVSLGYEFLHRLWLLGGVDDILSGDRRDYFVGLQLRFNDQDLKTILPFAPAGAL